MRIIEHFTVTQHGGKTVTDPTKGSQVWPDGTDKVATFPGLAPGDVVFIENDLTNANQSVATLRQTDGNMARAIYGFAAAKDLAWVGVQHAPQAAYMGQQGQIQCYEKPRAGYCDAASAPFIYIALIGPVDSSHPAPITILEGDK